ncbi:HlyD family efflux transporter periplasmic adaptor subunit [Pedobacter sp. BS3]|uniref:HlyD family secretion protein n=1 Tax=Pedobacter sp. BS3 TaxID=2567937 RepID=UPI0011EBAE27|nr:HlyD family efflux transporter periplasmic adaptor subunit [Pedobacter sp. BS3]TZF83700.1 HlyD family efflux transporter periplasmic adaptor subunit [Pedobacter sp. BS3]
MNRYHLFIAVNAILLCASCSGNKNEYTAPGNFEVDEVIVSAEQTGELLSFSVNEGDHLQAGDVVGQIDVTIPKLQQEQVQASIAALKNKTANAGDQVALIKNQLAVQQTQLAHLLHEQQRTANLVKADAATQKQLDDMDAQVEQLQKQIKVTRQQINVAISNTSTQNRGILSEKAPLEKTAQQFERQVEKGTIINPINGMVLTRYALRGEMAVTGKPLYKIANTDTLTLKAYVTGTQLPHIKTGDTVTVRVDKDKDSYRNYPGKITWISDKAEFTPKTIQTKDERANLVYAIKVRVKNDGYLKIGMYGEALFN